MRVRLAPIDDPPELAGSVLALPDEPGPGLVVLGGSEGGRPLFWARELAAQGYTSLALQYFGAAPLTRSLVEVPVELVSAGIDVVRDAARRSSGRVGLIGVSKGAELALLCASVFPGRVAAAVAYAPSAFVFGGISFDPSGRRRSSWSMNGAPLPFVAYPAKMRPRLTSRGVSLAPVYAAALSTADSFGDAAIAIEQADAPILLITGGRDLMWPSAEMARVLIARASNAGKPLLIRHLHYPKAGHSFHPWAPSDRMTLRGRTMNWFRLNGTGGVLALGGRGRANREALRDSWQQTLDFLGEHLR